MLRMKFRICSPNILVKWPFEFLGEEKAFLRTREKYATLKTFSRLSESLSSCANKQAEACHGKKSVKN